MAQTTFKFINVLHPNKVKDFKDLFISHCQKECSSWYCSRSLDGPEKTTVKGKLTFKVKRTLHDVNLWFVSIFENTLREHLSVQMVDGDEDDTNVHKLPTDGLYKPPPDFLKCKLYKKYGWKI